MIAPEMSSRVIKYFEGFEIWQRRWKESAIVIVGSVVRGIEDEYADADVLALVPECVYRDVYEWYRQAVECGQIEAVNPQAFTFDEFPLTLIPGIAGHYKLHSFEEVEAKIAAYDDVEMWIHGNAVVLHDPSGRYGNLQTRARTYPEDILSEKKRTHFLEAWYAASAASSQLRRNDRRSVALTMTDCLA
ncbi:MAG TPA: nucleotidyltransferase domain-containing protein, partial [Candidatus Hydrogenedentes bacterium]|nr:nucleotidyltransferase domain-containing protein [Candidatus Hydrogenedentota bacterium]